MIERVKMAPDDRVGGGWLAGDRTGLCESSDRGPRRSGGLVGVGEGHAIDGFRRRECVFGLATAGG